RLRGREGRRPQLSAPAARADDDRGTEAVPDRLPRGVRPARDGEARRGRREDRPEEAPRPPRSPDAAGLSRGDPYACSYWVRLEEARSRRLPLSGDVRLPQVHDL